MLPDTLGFIIAGTEGTVNVLVTIMLVGLCLPLPIVGRWLSMPLEPVYFEHPFFAIEHEACLMLYHSVYFQTEPAPPRTLGTIRQP